VDAVIDGNGGKLPSTVAESMQLRKMDDAMKEALRLYPAVVLFTRKADEGVGGELRSGGGGSRKNTASASAASGGKTFTVAQGSGMWISPYVMGRLPQHWGGDVADTAAYRPERFAEAEAAGVSLDAYMPFGGGPRVCLGSRFAMLEGKVLAAAIIRNFDLVRGWSWTGWGNAHAPIGHSIQAHQCRACPLVTPSSTSVSRVPIGHSIQAHQCRACPLVTPSSTSVSRAPFGHSIQHIGVSVARAK
jgi:hypothetical protein